MSLVGGLYQRFRHLIHEGSKFLVVGGIGFLVTWGLFNLILSAYPKQSFLANAVSTLIAAGVTFAGNRHWTFRHRERTGMGREAVVFFALNGVGVVIQQVCLELAKHMFGAHDKVTLNIAFLFGVGLATMFRFWSYRKFVWLAQPGGPSDPGRAGRPGPPPGGGYGYEDREPALVPPEPMPRPAPGRGPVPNGYLPNGHLPNGQLPGRSRTGGRHARPR